MFVGGKIRAERGWGAFAEGKSLLVSLLKYFAEGESEKEKYKLGNKEGSVDKKDGYRWKDEDNFKAEQSKRAIRFRQYC